MVLEVLSFTEGLNFDVYKRDSAGCLQKSLRYFRIWKDGICVVFCRFLKAQVVKLVDTLL